MNKKRLPHWTWIAPVILLMLSSVLSQPFSVAGYGAYCIYIPINLAIVMTLWWGPRVLAAVFLNSFFTMYLLHFSNPYLYPLYAIPETLEVFLAWILVRERFKNMSAWRPNPKNLILFFIHGLLIPSIICSSLIQALFVLTGLKEKSNFFAATMVTIIGNLAGGIFISIPLLILATPFLFRTGISFFKYDYLPTARGLYFNKLDRQEKITWVVLLSSSILLTLNFPLAQTWYVYGIFILTSAAWYGLYAAIFMNSFIVSVLISFPQIFKLPWANTPVLIETTVILLTLCFCSLITGSAVTSLVEKLQLLKRTENELTQARDKAEEASNAKSDFLARMSHEIRTPLNSVLGMLELLKETQLSGEQARYLTLFTHAGENLKALINDLLDFSKIEAKSLTVENISFDLYATVRSVFDILQIKAEEKGLLFELNIDKEVPQYQLGDPTRLRQVLFNIIGNALKFTSQGSVLINVIIEKVSNNLLIEIQDTGIGIPREKQSSLFTPFFQADAGIARKFGGTGLGLVISKNLVEILGGTLDMKSLAGRGTTFLISLPHRPDIQGHAKKKDPPQYSWQRASAHSRYRILVVDDSEDNRVLMTHYLKNLPFICEEAVNGEAAVIQIKTTRYDLIFMDIQMPIMSGYKATEMIRHWEKEQHLPPTPIVALTATAVLEDLKRTLTSGCDSYAVKPVKKNDILSILHHYLKDKDPLQESERSPSARDSELNH